MNNPLTRLFCLLIIFTAPIIAQTTPEALKAEAIQMQQRGRYGEAIDLLNKYISARPKAVDGYTLRGLSYEKRDQLEYAVYDFRSAKKLAPNDAEVNKNLSRATATWYAQLHAKIDGHRREIAINPNIAVNYLEIGKCHKHLGEWVEAEEWYDEYIKREEPSADEVIRYTEILAKNNHIEKGEKILKKFVEKYPRDHRLWSRYGYFTLWLGKRKIAREAFVEALKYRPYFKEAMDGLDICDNRPYEYTIYDTTARKTKEKPPPEYPIDRYFRILKANPQDTSTRFTLIEALVEVNRLEEAYEQLQLIADDCNGQPHFTVLWDTVNARRDRIFEKQSADYKARVEKNPGDKDAAVRLAEIYARKLDYDNAIEILKKYLTNKPTDQEHPTRFMLAKYSAWNYQFDAAIEQMNYLLAKEPNNLEYQLFRAQVAVWTWTDPDLAHQYLDNVLKDNPKNLYALVSKATLLVRERKFPEAAEMIQTAKGLSKTGKEVEGVQNFYDVSLSQEEERKNFEILVAARETAAGGDCPSAVEKYNDYFSKTKAPSKIELLEFADVNSCAKNFNKALEIYNQLLGEEYDYDIALLKAKATMWSGDSLSARDQFLDLITKDSTNYDAKFFLAEDYEHLKEIDSARALYDYLYETTTDSVKRDIIQKRIGWLPSQASSWENPFAGFPLYTRLSPNFSYYMDNQKLRIVSTGFGLELGLFSNFAVGASLGRVSIKGMSYSDPSLTVDRYFTTFKWNLHYYPFPTLYLFGGSGNLSYQGLNRRVVYEAGIKYEKPKKLSALLLYNQTDAALVLYSSKLADPTWPYYPLSAESYRFDGWYQMGPLVKLYATYTVISISDGNQGETMILKFGRKFSQDIVAGYEYDYVNFLATKSAIYYSPINYQAHCIWAEYSQELDPGLNATLGGRLGYVPADDVMIREINGGIEYKPMQNLVLAGKVTLGQSYREYSNYSYSSGFFSLFWSF